MGSFRFVDEELSNILAERLSYLNNLF